MIEFLTYEIATGRFTGHRASATADGRNANLAPGEAWVDGTRNELRTHYMVGEIKTERPLAAPETGTAPLTFTLPASATVTNEYGDSIEVVEGDDLTLEDAGEYTLVPAFPYRQQTVVVT